MAGAGAPDAAAVRSMVSEYYGKDLGGTADLKTSACCVLGDVSRDVRALLNKVHPEVLARFYGCGSPIPPLLSGRTVLDLGCGTGRDVYVAAQLVGPCGRVIGVDMTEEQIAVAEAHEDWHASAFGLAKPNTLFVQGSIEDLKRTGIKDESVDVVISNCVVNLVANKEAVFREVWRVLRPGGELFFSDVYTDRRVPEAAKADKVCWGECLAGALYRRDFARLMAKAGFAAYWVTSSREIAVTDPAIRAAVGATRFYSETVRAVKAPGLEEGREDYGDSVTYLGSIPSNPHAFVLGGGALFVTDMPAAVDGNTAAALQASRYAPHFRFSAPAPRVHRGAWRGAEADASAGDAAGAASACEPAAAGGACCAPGAGGGGSKCC